MEQEIRLARLEEKHEALCDRLDRFCSSVEKKTEEFDEIADSVKDMRSKAGLIAGIGVFVSTIVSAVAAFFGSK